MPKMKILSLFMCSLFFAAIAAFPTYSADSTAVPITTVVTVLGQKGAPPPPIAQEDVNVYSGKSKLAVISWTPARDTRADLQLAILINSADGSAAIGSELRELADFIQSQPKTTAVGLFYAASGTVQTASPFSTDHDAVAKTLHLTLGWRNANSPSIYLSLSSLIKKWPVPASRREVLLIASGFDPLYPGLDDPYLQSAINNAQKAGIQVHTLYSGGARLGQSFRGDIAQNNLSRLSTETGGANLYLGILGPVSFGPFLQNLDGLLSNQYLLTFSAPPSQRHKGEFRSIQVRLEEHNVKLLYPRQVFVPGP
ncbi:MAG: hypothetical protein ACLQMT_12785 [Candidatus Acidiferrales bacterium]